MLGVDLERVGEREDEAVELLLDHLDALALEVLDVPGRRDHGQEQPHVPVGQTSRRRASAGDREERQHLADDDVIAGRPDEQRAQAALEVGDVARVQ